MIHELGKKAIRGVRRCARLPSRAIRRCCEATKRKALRKRQKGITGTLLVSPHSDDIAIAAAHFLTLGILPAPLHLVTVFSRSEWVAPAWRSRLKPDQVMDVRLAEDAAFCSHAGAELHVLGLSDCDLREGRPLLDPAAPLDAAIVMQVEQSLSLLCRRLNIGLLAIQLPYGSQQHIDHRIAIAAATALCRSSDLQVIYLDDLPYSRLPIDQPVCDPLGRRLKPVVLRMSPAELQVKHRTMNLYETQMWDFYHQSVDQPASGDRRRSPSETVWAPVGHQRDPGLNRLWRMVRRREETE